MLFPGGRSRMGREGGPLESRCSCRLLNRAPPTGEGDSQFATIYPSDTNS